MYQELEQGTEDIAGLPVWDLALLRQETLFSLRSITFLDVDESIIVATQLPGQLKTICYQFIMG